MPEGLTSLLEAAATLGLKGEVIDEKMIVKTPDSFPIAGRNMEISAPEPGSYIITINKDVHKFSNPRTALAYAYNYASNNLLRSMSGIVSWTVRVLESYMPTRREEEYYSSIIGASNDPRLFLLALALTKTSPHAYVDNIFHGVLRLEEAGKILSIIRRRLNRIMHVRHSRLPLIVLGRIMGVNPLTILTAAYHAALTLSPGLVSFNIDPLSVILAWEIAWISNGCLQDLTPLHMVYTGLTIPLAWPCTSSGPRLHICPENCPYPLFIPFSKSLVKRVIPLEDYILYTYDDTPVALLIGSRESGIVRITSTGSGFHESLLNALSLNVVKADPRELTRLLL